MIAFAGAVPGPPVAPGSQAEVSNGPQQAQSEPQLRSKFPETWIWTDVIIE